MRSPFLNQKGLLHVFGEITQHFVGHVLTIGDARSAPPQEPQKENAHSVCAQKHD